MAWVFNPIVGFEKVYFATETGIPLAEEDANIYLSPRIEAVNFRWPIWFFSVFCIDFVLTSGVLLVAIG